MLRVIPGLDKYCTALYALVLKSAEASKKTLTTFIDMTILSKDGYKVVYLEDCIDLTHFTLYLHAFKIDTCSVSIYCVDRS